MCGATFAGKKSVTADLRSKAVERSARPGLRIGAPDDAYEREADRVANQVIAGGGKLNWSLSGMSMTPRLQRKCSCGGSEGAGGECEECKKEEGNDGKKVLQRKATGPVEADVAPPIVHEVLKSPGEALDREMRDLFNPRLGFDFSRVRIHADAAAATSARSINAQAYTVGNHVVFDEGSYSPQTLEGKQLLAHELTHVAQQGASPLGSGAIVSGRAQDAFEREADAAARNSVLGARSAVTPPSRCGVQPPILQKYEAGEHAQFGETGDILSKAISDRAFVRKVKTGETLKQIAAKYGISESDLIAANKAKLKRWSSNEDPERKVQGFNAGDEITIPPVINEATKEALKTKEISLMVNGVTLSYGEGIAMGDLFSSAEEMLKAPPAKLQKLAELIRKEKAKQTVTTDDWQKATGGDYLKLAEKNESHFAPSNASLVPVSGKSTTNHKETWEANHSAALQESQVGDKDKALATNAFADHFLTDAFAAGHLINKADVTQQFESKLPKTAKGDFTAASEAFFDAIAKDAFTGNVKTEFSKLQTVDCFSAFGDHPPAPCSDLTSGHADINSEKRFSKLLQKIQQKKPEVFENVVAKGVHDTLNKSGVPVENAKGDKWDLSGDGTLNAKSLEIGRKATAQSQLNVLGVFKFVGPIDFKSLFKKVWDYVPFPRAGAGEKAVKDAATTGTDPSSRPLVDAAVTLIRTHLATIIDELVNKRHELQRR
jgi:hypothetical protein